MSMDISDNGVKLIQVFESCRLKAYRDGKGIWTVGWGSIRINGRAVRQGDVVTQAQADAMLKAELKYMVGCVNQLLGSHKVPQSAFDAMTSFSYNVGPDIDADTIAEGLGDSTLLKKVLANPNDPTIKDEFIKWRNKGTDFEKGLLRRRLAEAHMYFTGELKYKEEDWSSEIKQIMKK